MIFLSVVINLNACSGVLASAAGGFMQAEPHVIAM